MTDTYRQQILYRGLMISDRQIRYVSDFGKANPLCKGVKKGIGQSALSYSFNSGVTVHHKDKLKIRWNDLNLLQRDTLNIVHKNGVRI